MKKETSFLVDLFGFLSENQFVRFSKQRWNPAEYLWNILRREGQNIKYLTFKIIKM